mgnify:CR=1 FL=1
MNDRYAVIGNPISHSKSPLIHAAFARQTHQALHYDALLSPLDGFQATVRHFQEQRGKGLNITVPFKLEAYQLATRLTERAANAQAVNTLKFDRQGKLEIKQSVAIPSDWKAKDLGVAAFVQNRETGETLQALQLPTCM